jgi:hypothetical protein
VKRICILTQNHISKNPRVLKESVLLLEAGYSVSVFTSWHSEEALQLDYEILKPYSIKYEAYSDLRPGNLTGLKHRIQFKIFRKLNAWGIESLNAGGYGAGSLIKKAIKEAADLFIIHQEIPTMIAPKLHAAGYKVAFDFEDWYSRDLPYSVRRYRPVKRLAQAEKWAIQQGIWCTTTSLVLAKALAKTAGHSRTPEVIYNAFSLKERKGIQHEEDIELSQNSSIRLAWISQTIGPGRGLEEFLEEIIPIKRPIEIHLAGFPRKEFINGLLEKIQNISHIKIQIHPTMPPSAIVPWLHSFDGGIASDIASYESRDLTVTNKILHYLLAGIPVIAGSTQGHKEIAEYCPNTVFLLNGGRSLSNFLESISPNSPTRNQIRKNAWEDGTKFSWENQGEKILRLVANSLA